MKILYNPEPCPLSEWNFASRPEEGRHAARAEARLSTHELMAKSGHKNLAEVQRYTDAANKKLLADSGAEKEREARAKTPKLITAKKQKAS